MSENQSQPQVRTGYAVYILDTGEVRVEFLGEAHPTVIELLGLQEYSNKAIEVEVKNVLDLRSKHEKVLADALNSIKEDISSQLKSIKTKAFEKAKAIPFPKIELDIDHD